MSWLETRPDSGDTREGRVEGEGGGRRRKGDEMRNLCFLPLSYFLGSNVSYFPSS
jgi:hypothetical protein